MWLNLLIIFVIVLSANADPGHIEDLEYNGIKQFAPVDPDGFNFRLPNNSRPIHYDVLISTDIHIGHFEFNGSVSIHFRTLLPSTEITINFKQLQILEIHLDDANSQTIENFVNFEKNDFTELLVIRPQTQLPANMEFIMKIDYAGVMRTDSYGFYRGFYVDENGSTRWFGATQFQATDARHAFPW